MKIVLIFRPSEHHNNSLTVVFGLALTQIIDVVNDLKQFCCFYIENSLIKRMKETRS